jgi:hypothetical protein
MNTKNIKVNVENANSELVQRELDKYLDSKNIINLSKRVHTRDRLQNIARRRKNTPEYKIIRFASILIPLSLLVLIFSI